MKTQILNLLRDRSASIGTFRIASQSLSKLVASEIASQLQAHTPVLVPILRAGLALLPAFEHQFEEARIGFLGIRRDETTAKPHLYYQNLPHPHPNDHVLLLDPMLATGGSANLALDILKSHGWTRITLISLIAAPEGLHAVQHRHPDTRIYTVAIDQKLDAKKYIVPGLGDYGDRYFGTTD